MSREAPRGSAASSQVRHLESGVEIPPSEPWSERSGRRRAPSRPVPSSGHEPLVAASPRSLGRRASHQLLPMLADGRLHLTAVAKLAGHFTPENRDDLLAQATHRSKREVEELIAELAPRPEVAAAIRRLPPPRPAVPSRPRNGRASLLSSARPSHGVRVQDLVLPWQPTPGGRVTSPGRKGPKELHERVEDRLSSATRCYLVSRGCGDPRPPGHGGDVEIRAFGFEDPEGRTLGVFGWLK